jgi:hypothetical protein
MDMSPAATKLKTEIATYEANRADFVANHPDEFVLIKDSDVIGFYPTEIEAISDGYAKYADQIFLVRKVAESETPVFLTSLNVQVAR